MSKFLQSIDAISGIKAPDVKTSFLDKVDSIANDGVATATIDKSNTEIIPKDLSFIDKMLTNPIVSNTIDTLAVGLQKATGMNPQQQMQAGERNVEYLKSIPKMFMESVPEPSDLINPSKLLERAANTLGVISTPFVPAFQGVENAIQSGLRGRNIPEIAQSFMRGAADPSSVKLISDPENLPFTKPELEGGTSSLIPRAILQGLEQAVIGHVAFGGLGRDIKAGIEKAKVEGAGRDFEADFSKITPEFVQEHLEKNSPGFSNLMPQQKAILVDDAIKGLRVQLLNNPEVGDIYFPKQTLPKLAGEAEMSMRDGMKGDLPFRKGERGSTGATEGETGKTKNDSSTSEQVPQPEQIKNLVVMHNLSEDSLVHADKIGGLAVPSLSVGKVDHPLEGFGDITLLGSKELIDPKKRSNKVFNADIYSPRYPSVKYDFDSKVLSEARKSVSQEEHDLGRSLSSDIDSRSFSHKGMNALYESPVLRLKYLRSIGKDINIPRKEIQNSYIALNPNIEKYVDTWNPPSDLYQNKDFLKEYENLRQEVMKDAKNKALLAGDSKENAQYLSEEYGKLWYEDDGKPNYNLIRQLMDEASRKKEAGQPDYYAADRLINEEISKHKKEFDNWVDENYSNLIGKERLYNGEDRNYNRRYLPHTLENVVKVMKRELQSGEGFNYGLGNIRASVAKQYKSIKEIQSDRNKILSKEMFEQVKEFTDKEFDDIVKQAYEVYEHKDRSGIGDTFTQVLIDGIRHHNIEKELKEYGFGGMDMDRIKAFLDVLKDMPTEYFESEMQRAVGLHEFSGALVPHGTSDKAIRVLERSGLKYVKYDRNKEGDRARAIKEFNNQLKDKSILFEKQDELFDTNNPQIGKEVDGENESQAHIRKVIEQYADIGEALKFGEYIRDEQGRKAAGVYFDNLIKLDRNATVHTAMHELKHMIFDIFLTKEERAALIKITKDHYKISDDTEAMEKMAKGFTSFSGHGYSMKDTNSFMNKVKGFFQRLLYRIKKFLGIKRSRVEDFYNDILNKKFKGAKSKESPNKEKRYDKWEDAEEKNALERMGEAQKEKFDFGDIDIRDKAEIEIGMLAEGNIHPLEKAMKDVGLISPNNMREIEEYKEIPERFRSHFVSKETRKNESEAKRMLRGRPVDERMQELKTSHGISFESTSEFRQALKALGNTQMKFGLSDDVKQYLRNKEIVDAIDKRMSGKLAEGKVKKIINSYSGVKRPKTDIIIQTTEQQVLKHLLKVREKASKEGFVAGKKEGYAKASVEGKSARVSAINALKNQFDIERQALVDEIRGQRLKDDIIARSSQKLKNELVAYVKDALPKESQHKYLKAIVEANTASQASKVFRGIWKEALDIDRRDTVSALKDAMKEVSEAANIAVEYKKMLGDIFGEVDFTKRRPETLDRLTNTMNYIKKQKELGNDVFMPQEILKELDILKRRPISELSIAELKNMLSNINDLIKLGKTKKRVREELESLRKERIKNEVLEGSVPIEKQKQFIPLPGEKLTAKEKFLNVFPSISNGVQRIDLSLTFMNTFFDMLDGGKAKFDGANYRNFKQRVDTNYQTYLRLANTFIDEVVQASRTLKLTDRNFERIGVHAARVQEGGRQKLIDSGMTDKQIDNIVLSDEETKFYSLMRKKLDEMRPMIVDVMRDVYNKDVGTVTNYFSFMTDFKKLSEADMQDRIFDLPEYSNKPSKTVEKGFTEKRTLGYQPIKINAMDVFVKHMDNAAYLVTMAKDIKTLFEIANSPDYREAVGETGQVIVRDWLDLIAKKGGVGGNTRIALLDLLRKNFGVAQLGANLSTILLQPTAIFDGASLIGKYAFDGLYQITVDSKSREFVSDNMPELKARIGDDPVFREFGKGLWDSIQKKGYIPIKLLDGWTATGVAYGAYLKKINELGIELDLDKPNKEAITYAQRVVADSQASGEFKDLPLALSKGKLSGNISIDKAFLHFQTFLLKRWDNIDKKMIRAYLLGGRTGDKQRDIKSAALMLSMLLLAYFTETMYRRKYEDMIAAIAGKTNKHDATFTEDFVKNLATSIPFVSQALSLAVYRGDLIPSFGGIRKVAEGAYTASGVISDKLSGKKTKEKPKAFVNILTGIGALTGMPATAMLSKVAKNVVDATSDNAVDLYERALRSKEDKEFQMLTDRADEIAVRNRVLKEDARKAAIGRIRKEIIDNYELFLTTDKEQYLDAGDELAKTAGLDKNDVKQLEKAARKRLDKSKEKADKIEEQSRSYVPQKSFINRLAEFVR